MADISEARNALGYMRNVLASFQNADKVLAALENADQVQKELTLANDAVREQLDARKNDLAATDAQISEKFAKASADIARMVSEAHVNAGQTLAAAEDARDVVLKEKLEAEALLAEVLEQKAAAEAARDGAAEDYTEMTAKLAAAKAQLSALLV